MILPTLRQLQYLTAVVELKHFGHAVEQCFVTQSTLSAGIQDLEALLGVPLLERTNRKVLPTALGKELASQAQHILSLSADFVDLAQSEKHPLAGKIRLGLIPTISPFLLPKVLPSLRKQLPNIELTLIEDQSERLLEQLRAGIIDVAVLAFPFEIKGLSQKIFAEESFWLALPNDHPLTSYKSISPSQLPVDDLLLLTEGHCLRQHALSACQLPASTQRSSVQGTSLYTLIEMVASGLGITLIPEMALNTEMVKHADICLRPLKTNASKPMRELGIVWRPSYRRTKTLDHIIQIFTQALSS